MDINISTIRESERVHYIMQLSSYFSELTDLPGVRFSYTYRFTDIWYNQAYDIEWTSDIKSLKTVVEEYLAKRDRLPCIYTSPATEPENIGKLLEDLGYGMFEEEAWMFYNFDENKKAYTIPDDISITEVKTEQDLEIFAEVYRKGLPGPEVEDYVEACLEGFKYKPPLVNIWYFIAKYQGAPAGMISLLTLGKYAGIYAVATIEEFQKKGIVRALNWVACALAEKVGCKYAFLQTVKGEDSELVFEKLGYETLFIREGYTTKQVIADLEHG